MMFFIAFIMMYPSFAFQENKDSLYTIQGMIINHEKLEPIPFVRLYNDSLKLSVFSDENGYYKIVLKNANNKFPILLKIGKEGYQKRDYWYPYDTSFLHFSNMNDSMKEEMKNHNAELIKQLGNDALVFIYPPDTNHTSLGTYYTSWRDSSLHDYQAVYKIFIADKFSEERSRKLNELMSNNDKIYFKIDSLNYAIVSSSYNILFTKDERISIIINGKKTNIKKLNKKYKRSEVKLHSIRDKKLFKKYGVNGFELIIAKHE